MKKFLMQLLPIFVLSLVLSANYALALSGVDLDCDNVDDSIDNCPKDTNPSQADWDKDGKGDVCDTNGCPKSGGWVEGDTCGCIDTMRYMSNPGKFLNDVGSDPIATQARKIVARYQLVKKNNDYYISYRGLGYYFYYSNKLKTWMYINPWTGVLNIWNASNWEGGKNGVAKDVYVAQLGGGTDACGICAGDGSSCSDCAHIPNGKSVTDTCGVCGGDGTSCMVAKCDDYPIQITRYMDQPTKLLSETNSSTNLASQQAYNLVRFYKLVQKGLITENKTTDSRYDGMYWYFSNKINETMSTGMSWFYLNPMSGVINLWNPNNKSGPSKDIYIAQLGGGSDACGVCQGYGSTCADCKGIPKGTAILDACKVCAGDGSSCAPKGCELYSITKLPTARPYGTGHFIRTLIKVEAEGLKQNPFSEYVSMNNLDTGWKGFFFGKMIFSKWETGLVANLTPLMKQVRKIACAIPTANYCPTKPGSMYQGLYLKLEIPFTVYFDKLGKLVTSPTSAQKNKACLLYTVNEMFRGESPISFQWSTEKSVKSTIVNFPLTYDVNNQENAWTEWRASAATPLLVIDKEMTGKINNSKQLFGTWTFGGKNVEQNLKAGHAKIAAKQIPWNDGYEALGSLDFNKNGSLETSELNDLALWFDNNQDGVSQVGEVKSLSELKVTKIFYQGYKENQVTGDLELALGYERLDGTKTISGKSFDWFPIMGASKSAVEAQIKAIR